MSDGDFSPSRLTLARRRRGYTKVKLARLLSVEARSITAYEAGEFRPENDRLADIAKLLRFPVSFFFGVELDRPTPDTASFRAMSRMTAAIRDSALGSGAIALMLNKWIDARFELPRAELPDLSRESSPEVAAESLRQMWGLGELPIKNMVHLLESKGIRVYTLAIDASEVDAFSMWHDDTPFVFLNTKKSCEHSRFDAAHELGHLVMHCHGAPVGQATEREANAFASAFLMPRGSVLGKAPRFATIDALVKLKKFWTVSVSALTYRLHTLGVLSDWHYRSLFIELASRGYRTKEPNEAPREISQVLAKVFAALRDEGVTRQDIAEELDVFVEEIDYLVFGLALTSLSGMGRATTRSERPNLRVVET